MLACTTSCSCASLVRLTPRSATLFSSTIENTPPPVEETLPWLVCSPGVVHILVRVGLGSDGRTEANTPELRCGWACGEMLS